MKTRARSIGHYRLECKVSAVGTIINSHCHVQRRLASLTLLSLSYKKLDFEIRVTFSSVPSVHYL